MDLLVWCGLVLAIDVADRFGTTFWRYLAIGSVVGWSILVSRWRLAHIESALAAPLDRSLPEGIPRFVSTRMAALARAIRQLRIDCVAPRSDGGEKNEREAVRSQPVTLDDLWSVGCRDLAAVDGVGEVAVILADQESGVTIYGPLTASTRYRSTVARLYGDYLRFGEVVPGGIRDGSLSRSVFGDFVELGFRYVSTYPLRWYCDGENRRALIWVGFLSDIPPAERAIEECHKKASWIQERLYVLEAVTEVSRQAHQAEFSDARKSEFLAHISHDIRSPLNTIRAVLALLQGESTDPGAAEIIDIALRNCDAVGDLVGDILDFTRYKEGRLEPRPESIALRPLIHEVLRNFDLAIRERSLEIAVVAPDCAMNVRFDRRHLHRIVSNLIGNAIKYTERGTITVTLHAAGAEPTLVIADSGMGMTEAELTRLFTPFSRFGDERIEGVGLGLTVTKALLEANGASIEVQSTPHIGSTFTITFGRIVACRDRESQSHAAPVIAVARVPARRPTVLLIDDDRDSCMSLARALSGFPVETMVATTVPEGMSLFNFAEPDVVVTDLGMPLGGGERLIEYVRASGRKTPIYCLSGASDGGLDMREAVQGVFQKPVDVRALWCAIESAGRVS